MIWIEEAELEKLIQEIGQQLHSLVKAESKPVISSYWWKQKGMEYFMKDPELRTQMLKFVDVFPALKESKEINWHFREYFLEELNEMRDFQSKLGLFQMASALNRIPLGGKALAFFIKLALNQTAQHFVVRPEPEQISRAIQNLEREKIHYILDILGEAVISESEANKYLERYLYLISTLKSWGLSFDVSLKPTSLYSQFNPIDPEGSCQKVKQRLTKILKAAQLYQIPVTLDVEQFYFQDLIFKIFRETFNQEQFKGFQLPGIAAQTYILDWQEKLNQIIYWAKGRKNKILIRLVRGAYLEHEIINALQKGWPIPVFQEKWQTDLAFETATNKLMKNSDILRPAFGTHSIRSVSRAIALAEILEIPRDQFEFQFLWGMGKPLARAVQKLGKIRPCKINPGMNFVVKLYGGSGNILQGMGFLVRRLIENTSQASSAFFMSSFSQKELLESPEEKRKKEGKCLK